MTTLSDLSMFLKAYECKTLDEVGCKIFEQHMEEQQSVRAVLDNIQKNIQSVIKCPKCGSSNVCSKTSQERAGDEGETTRGTCFNRNAHNGQTYAFKCNG